MIYIVTGLPRSGTSMMMLMLKEGGIQIYYDPIRKSWFNPNGNYDFIRRLSEFDDESYKLWMGKTENSAIKIVFNHLDRLPKEYKYKFIYMKREFDEIVKSALLGSYEREPNSKESNIIINCKKGLEKGLLFLKDKEYIEINYNNLMNNPRNELSKLINFLPKTIDLEKMLLIPDNSLYRNRKVDIDKEHEWLTL